MPKAARLKPLLRTIKSCGLGKESVSTPPNPNKSKDDAQQRILREPKIRRTSVRAVEAAAQDNQVLWTAEGEPTLFFVDCAGSMFLL
jgi:hypothetical protein